MGTGYADHIRHIYRIERERKTYTVYELVEVQNGPARFPSIVRIEQFNGKSGAYGIDTYFRIRNTSNWGTCEKVTGLRPYRQNAYYGDVAKPDKSGPESLLLFHVEGARLVIDYFPRFYPYNKGQLLKMARNHRFLD